MRRLLGSAMVAIAIAITGCSSEPQRSTTGFCELLADYGAFLEGPLSTPSELASLLGRYRELASRAPLAIEEDWNLVVTLVDTAASVDRDDPLALADLVDLAFATDLAARRLDEWTQSRCGLVLVVPDPLAQIPPTTGSD